MYNFLMFLFTILMLILTFLNLVFHISHLYSKSGFTSKNQFLFSYLIFIAYSILFFYFFLTILSKLFPNAYIFIFIAYHSTIFFNVYAFNIFIFWLLKRLSLKINYFLNYISKFLLKIKTSSKRNKTILNQTLYFLASIIYYFLPKSDFYLIPLEYNFMKIPIYKNTSFLRKILLISYFSSILIFIFIFKNYIISFFTNESNTNKELLMEDFKLYYNAFFLSSITVLIAFKNNKK